MDRKVKELMHEGVISCQQGTSLQEAARMMVENDISALVVVDANGMMVGLLSRTDLVKTQLELQDLNKLRGTPVSDIMTRNVFCVSPTDTLGDAMRMIMQRHIHRVVVTEKTDAGARPVGVLSVTDIVRDMAG